MKSHALARRAVTVTAATSVALVGLVMPAQAEPTPDVPEDRSTWTEEQLLAQALEAKPERDLVEPIDLAAAPAGDPVAFEEMPLADPVPAVEWPDPITALRPARPGQPVVAGDRAGGFEVRAERAALTPGRDGQVGRMRAQVFDRAAARRAGVDGVLLSVTNPGGVDAPVEVEVDYAPIAAGYGGDWSSRLRLVSLPECALTTPGRPECRVQSPVEATNDVDAGVMSATVEASSLGVMALSAGSSGPTGDWSATPLSPSATWQVSAQTGAFSWSYPMRVPPGVGGPQPQLALNYSAASLDGKVVTTNNQTSWIGEGWSLETGYVERKYVSCSDDMTGGNNATHETYDLCWRTDNASLVFNGQALELVRDATTGTWRAKDDDGTRVERLTGANNGDNDGEYWKVTTTDGTQYYFGRGRRPADNLALNSTWTVPVFGNNTGEPCYASTFAASSCTQAWRWNLEYVVDPSGNTLTYVYATETNNYGRNLGTAVSSYVRGGYLTRIEYGQQQGSENSATAPARVVFDVAERCIPSGGVTCDPAQLTAANASSWPDVPFDLICTSTTSCPSQVSPAFFTRKRLSTVTTQVLNGGAYQNVDRWALTHTFPDPGDGTGASLWLDKIGHSGLVGGTVTLPDVQFYGTQMPNRVDTIGDYGPPMIRYRLTGITSETGGTISVNYTPADCTTTNLPTSADANTRRCMPVVWDPEGGIGPITEYFHKYLVDSVVANPGTGGGTAVETHYAYVGAPAWRYDDSPLSPDEYRTWGDFRGYDTVDVLTGAPSTPDRLRVRYRYFRGMDGDRLSAGGTKTVTIDQITDEDRLSGFQREAITYNGDAVVTASLTWPWLSAPTATGNDGTQARFLDVAQTQTRTPLAAGGERTTRTVTTYDPTFGTPTQVEDQGDTAIPDDDRCTRVEYARNTNANIVATVSRTETVAASCSQTPARPGDVISDVRTAYDNRAVGDPPTRGLPTRTERVASYNGTQPVTVIESTTTYDAHGRPLSVADALGRTTSTAYTPATGGPVTAVTTTSPDPDGPGALTSHVTTTEVNPAWGAPVKVTDPNGKVTTATYDALGRITAVWLPGRAQGTKSANTTYAYTISTTGVNAVTTQTLTAAEGYLTSVTLYDGLLRPRQAQAPSADRDVPGRVITDTEYDSRGLTTATNGQWYTTGSPATALAYPASSVPSRTEAVYDGAGRVVTEIFKVLGAERWRTTTTYGGDRVSIDPPAGAVPTTSIADARGQTVELRQYTGAAPTGTAYEATTYSYDDAGRLAGMTDDAGNTWSYGYDLRGRQITATDPDKGTTTTTHDDAGQVTSVTDARGQTLVNTYDNLGRRTQLRETSPTGPVRASWTYDTLAKGQVTSATRLSGGASYVTAITGYDDGYRPLGQSVTIPAAEGALAGTYTTTYAYMPNGQPKSTKLPAAGGLRAETVTTQYDAVSMPMRTSGGLGFGMYQGLAEYDAYGKLVQSIVGSTYFIYVGHTYETGTNRLTGTWVNREIAPATYDLQTTYTYDDAGNPTSAVDAPTTGDGETQCFTYDGLRRLTNAWTPASGSCATPPSSTGLGGPAPYGFTDTFDTIGNRTARTTYAAGGNTTHTYTYPAAGTEGAHTLTSVTATGPAGTTTNTYGYDDAGNTTSRTVAGNPAQTLTWDAEGELASLAEAGGATDSYLYTADGDRLIRRQDGTTTVYLPGGMELTLAGGQVKATRYYSFNGQTIAVRTGSTSAGVWTLIPDRRGTAQLAIQNSTSTVTRKYTDPYGNPRGTAPTTWAGDHGYLDKPTDTTGLTAIGARYYDAAIGRFISVDPVMDLADPQQWHGYAYSNNNPITWSDPTGLAPTIDGQWGSPHAAAAAKKGQYVLQGPKPPTVRELLLRLEDDNSLGSRQAYVALVDSLDQDDWDTMEYWEYEYHSARANQYRTQLQTCQWASCSRPCTARDMACQGWEVLKFTARFAAEAALGLAFTKLFSMAVAARPLAGAGQTSRLNMAEARFAQNSYSETFSSGGAFAGRTIDEVAGALRSGALSPKNVPIDVIVRDGNTLILNTRSSQALIRAGIPRSAWNVVDRTGQAAFESRLSGQLSRSGLTSEGTELP